MHETTALTESMSQDVQEVVALVQKIVRRQCQRRIGQQPLTEEDVAAWLVGRFNRLYADRESRPVLEKLLGLRIAAAVPAEPMLSFTPEGTMGVIGLLNSLLRSSNNPKPLVIDYNDHGQVRGISLRTPEELPVCPVYLEGSDSHKAADKWTSVDTFNPQHAVISPPCHPAAMCSANLECTKSGLTTAPIVPFKVDELEARKVVSEEVAWAKRELEPGTLKPRSYELAEIRSEIPSFETLLVDHINMLFDRMLFLNYTDWTNNG